MVIQKSDVMLSLWSRLRSEQMTQVLVFISTHLANIQPSVSLSARGKERDPRLKSYSPLVFRDTNSEDAIISGKKKKKILITRCCFYRHRTGHTLSFL